jgi:hypothetical protein
VDARDHFVGNGESRERSTRELATGKPACACAHKQDLSLPVTYPVEAAQILHVTIEGIVVNKPVNITRQSPMSHAPLKNKYNSRGHINERRGSY